MLFVNCCETLFLTWVWCDERDEYWRLFPDLLFESLEVFARVLHVVAESIPCIGPTSCHASDSSGQEGADLVKLPLRISDTGRFGPGTVHHVINPKPFS